MLNGAFSFGLANTISKAAARAVSIASYLKNNLKAYFDFKNTDLEHVGTGSANISTPSDGSGDWIEYTDATLLDAMEGIDTLTIMAWVRRDDNTGFAFITKGGYYGSNTDWGSEWQGSNGRMRFSIEQNFTAWEPPPDTYVNTWVHYAITYDKNCEGGNIHRVVNTYYNGDQDYGYGSGTPATVGTNGNNIRIGATSTGVGPLRGNIKNVGIWNRVLSKEEVRNVMYKSYSDLKGSELTNLQLWADLDTDFNGKDGNGRTITGSAAGNANIMQGLYGNNLPIIPRGVDNSKSALANQIGSGSAYFVTVGESTEDYITCGDGAHTGEGQDNFTCTVWIKHDESASDDFGRIVGKGHDDSWQLMIDEDSTDMSIAIYINNNLIQTGVDVITQDKWHHIGVTYTSASNGTCHIYVDGALVHSDTTAGGGATIGTNDHDLIIGADESTTTQGWGGYIAQLGIWSRVLSQEEIQSVKEKTYEELATSEKVNILCYYGLDEIFLGSNFLETPNEATSYARGSIVEDKAGSLREILIDNIDTLDNWEVGSNATISINGDGNLLATGSGGSGTIRIKSDVVTLETDSVYIFEFEVVGGNDTSANLRIDETAYGSVTYFNGYYKSSLTSTSTPGQLSGRFNSHSSATGFYLQLSGIDDTKTTIIKHFKLYKVTSGNPGVLI